jgi:hypothetical protein
MRPIAGYGLNPSQLRRVADKMRDTCPPPAGGQRVNEYVRNEFVHNFAASLDAIADEDEAK